MVNSRKPKNYLSEPKFQFRFLRFLLLASLLQVSAIGVLLFHFLRQNYTYLVMYAGLDKGIQTVLDQELLFLIYAIASIFVLHLIIVLGLGLIFSHRVGGAIYALKRTIRQIHDGENVELRLRKGDEFQELVDSFNDMVSQLKRGQQMKRAEG